VTDRADVQMRLAALELLLCHCPLSSVFAYAVWASTISPAID
jgi:hypothetical protein